MAWLHSLAWYLGGAFLLNAIPHIVAGAMGRPFQSPFAKPPGEGLSSSAINVVWGFANLVVAYLLLFRVGEFDLRSTEHAITLGLGMFMLALLLARRFGRFNGGNSPTHG
jgi:hypothetical protein